MKNIRMLRPILYYTSGGESHFHNDKRWFGHDPAHWVGGKAYNDVFNIIPNIGRLIVSFKKGIRHATR